MAKLRYEVSNTLGDVDVADDYFEAVRIARQAAKDVNETIYIDVMDNLDNALGEMKDWHYTVSPDGKVAKVF
jgi:hypothetical protein